MNIYLKQEKFHRIAFKKYYVSKLVKDELTIRTLLCYYQELACKKYYNESLQTYVLGKNYDARFNVHLKKVGTYIIIEYSLTSVDPLYINDPDYTVEGLENLFNELIIPRFWNKKCVKSLFNKAKEIYMSDLYSRFENPSILSFENAIKHFYKGTIRDYDSYGSLEDLESITEKELFDYYQKVIKEETISIGSGNFVKENDNSFNLKPKKDFYFNFRGNCPSYLYEDFDSDQCYLEVIYDTGIYSLDKLGIAARAINFIFGGKASSNLFNIVREKYGLCYSISSMYLGASGLIVVSAIINYSDIEKVLNAIDEAFDMVKELDFNIDEIKEYFISNISQSKDNFNTLIDNYFLDNYFVKGNESYKELEKINDLKMEDIKEALNQIKRVFVYAYGGKKND